MCRLATAYVSRGLKPTATMINRWDWEVGRVRRWGGGGDHDRDGHATLWQLKFKLGVRRRGLHGRARWPQRAAGWDGEIRFFSASAPFLGRLGIVA